MNRGIIVGGVLMLSLVIVWFVIFSMITNRNCPDTLPSSYYTCDRSENCYFHPKYDCINYNSINCIINEDLSASQQAQGLLECNCVDNTCITQVRK